MVSGGEIADQPGEVISTSPFSVAVRWLRPGDQFERIDWFNWWAAGPRHGVRHGDSADWPVRISLI